MKKRSRIQDSLGFQAMGLLCSFTMYGYLQEKIMSGTYGPHKFRSTVILVAFNRLAGILVAIYMQSYHLGNSLRPRHPIWAYASVSLSNFLSTLCQYEALKYVNFTTQTLGKCSKMIPVLLLGVLVYGKKYSWRNYAAVGLVTIGTTVYMVTTNIKSSDNKFSTVRGIGLLVGYLLFDALASTTEARLFQRGNERSRAKDKSSKDTSAGFSKDEMVYDQMLWTNICSLGVSVISTDKRRSLSSFLQIAFSPYGPRLLLDIALLSLSASIGLIFLLTVIATFGALTCSTLMTSRQFLSIVLNGVAFRNGRNVGTLGWIGIGYVASGVQLELSNKKKVKQEKEDMPLSPTKHGKGKESNTGTLARYLFLPIVGGILAHITSIILIPSHIAIQSRSAELFPTSPIFTYGNQTYTRSQIQHLSATTNCPEPPKRSFYPFEIPRTALASFPRSGNTFTRELVEHSTGYFTTDVFCNSPHWYKFHQEYFEEACEHPENNLLVKTHAPEFTSYGDDDAEWLPLVEEFERIVQVVRNPLDSLWSFWHFLRNDLNHTSRIAGIDLLGLHHLSELDLMAHAWVQHTEYWMNLDKPRVMVRYEDFRGPDQIQHLSRVLTTLLPDDQLPEMERLICADDDRKIAYQSRKARNFYSWDHYDPELRQLILEAVKGPWCALGYEDLLRKERGIKGVDCD
uniref:Sulfotransferase domain-containing protein n=1 Tax=Kwoniella bestiolae CBS 10118 TaxID=1296100 RepID=A0A1B9GD72_9TREE|nr:hypothetical protein I302_00460 [Kwoniella bestiolae CBS 10118]OCF28969.1 hypothetical protein I302_00460 [Kwoniella bestiolae CBS 10118]